MIEAQEKLCFQQKIMQNTVEDKKRASQPRLDLKRIFYKKWLIFSKTQVLTQNGVRPRESLLSTKNNVKHSLGRKTLFST